MALLPCDLCSFEAKNRLGLSVHKQKAHGIDAPPYKHPYKRPPGVGTSGAYPCPECDFRAKRPQGLAIHRKRFHGVPASSRSTQYIKEKAYGNASRIVEAATRSTRRVPARSSVEEGREASADAVEAQFETTYCFGYIKGWLDRHAQAVGIPTGLLADGVGELLRRSARR